jgi:hypothetical protein
MSGIQDQRFPSMLLRRRRMKKNRRRSLPAQSLP